MANDIAKLPQGELSRLLALEEVIQSSLQSFFEVGNALKEIRDSRYYRTSHKTFDDYCRERWGMSRVHAHRTIECASVMESLLPIGNTALPSSESQCRPLTQLEPEQQQEAWEIVVKEADGKPVTAKLVSSVVAKLRGTEDGDDMPDDTEDKLAWPQAMERAVKQDKVTLSQLAEWLGKKSTPDVRKGMSIMAKCQAFSVEQIGPNVWRVRRGKHIPSQRSRLSPQRRREMTLETYRTPFQSMVAKALKLEAMSRDELFDTLACDETWFMEHLTECPWLELQEQSGGVVQLVAHDIDVKSMQSLRREIEELMVSCPNGFNFDTRKAAAAIKRMWQIADKATAAR